MPPCDMYETERCGGRMLCSDDVVISLGNDLWLDTVKLPPPLLTLIIALLLPTVAPLSDPSRADQSCESTLSIRVQPQTLKQ